MCSDMAVKELSCQLRRLPDWRREGDQGTIIERGMIQGNFRCICYNDDDGLGIGMGGTTGAGAEWGAFISSFLVIMVVCQRKCGLRCTGFHGNGCILTGSTTHDQDQTGHYESEKFHRG